MKKSFTIIELVIVIVILGIFAMVSFPMYNKIIKRTGFKEVASIVNLVRAGAKYYDLKYDLSNLPAGETAWGGLKVDKPAASGAELTYTITASETTGNPELEVSYDDSLLYEYDLITETGAPTEDPNAAYLPADLP
jgi:prepilin-type N-terminal cleavage/methylation domain-containing protein